MKEKKQDKWKEPGAIPSSITRILIYNLVQLFGVTAFNDSPHL